MASTDPRPPPLVLLIHDRMSVANLMEYLISHGLHVAHLQNDASMLEAVVEVHPDLILLDFAVNGGSVETLKADARTQHIPLIGLTDLCRLFSEEVQ
jgi:DNA-binding response OmpR family regulator